MNRITNPPSHMSLDRFVKKQDLENVSDVEAGMYLKAIQLAMRCHSKQTRDDGETEYAQHLLIVADCLSGLGFSIEVQIAGLLHDAQEDCGLDNATIRRRYGIKVANMVQSLSKPKDSEVDFFEQLYLGVNDYFEVIFIKLVDRWHNLTTVYGFRDHDRQVRFLKETLGPMRSLCERCEHLVPEDYQSCYKAMVKRILSLAKGLLEGFES